MAANIFETDNMFSVRTTPWHGMGVVIQDAPSSDEAIRIAGLDWNVVQGEAFVRMADGRELATTSVANVRDKDGMVLGLVKPNYRVVQNQEAFDFTDSLIGTGEVKYETAGSLYDGKVVWMLARMPETSLLGDRYENYLLFSNSHDGSSAVRVMQTPVRVVCANTLNLALGSAERSIAIPHKGDIKEKLQQARQVLSFSKEYKVAFEKNAETLARKKISQADAKAILDKMFPIEDNGVTELQMKNRIKVRQNFQDCLNADDLQNFKGTAWGYVQAASDYIFHKRPLRLSANYADNRMMSVIQGNKFLDQMMELVAA